MCIEVRQSHSPGCRMESHSLSRLPRDSLCRGLPSSREGAKLRDRAVCAIVSGIGVRQSVDVVARDQEGEPKRKRGSIRREHTRDMRFVPLLLYTRCFPLPQNKGEITQTVTRTNNKRAFMTEKGNGAKLNLAASRKRAGV